VCFRHLCWDFIVINLEKKVKSEEIKFEDDMQNTFLLCRTAKMRVDFEELQHHVSVNNRAIN